MINFANLQKCGAFFFVALLFIFAGTYFYKLKSRGYAFVYSIDFTGGTQVLLKFSQPVTSEQVTTALRTAGFQNAVTREFSPTEMAVRVQEFADDVTGTAGRMKQALEASISGLQVEIRQTDSVGAGVGASLWWNGLKAGLACLIVMLVYILARFWSLGFAMGAVGSLFHDALLILTFCLLFDYEISINILAAIFIVLGYSINDTIIIFARIRENMAQLRNVTLPEIVNISIRETLRRTMLTTISTVLVVISLIVFGGSVLRPLSTALLVGFVFGTYSSICVASPIMLFFNRTKVGARS